MKTDLIKKNDISKCFLSPLPLLEAREDFYLHCENLAELLKVKLTDVWGPLWDWVSLEFFGLRHVYTEPPANPQSQFSFP